MTLHIKTKIFIPFVIMICLLLSACGHEHTWVDATCTEPKTCSECGETEGEALGHTWIDATCTEPKTCSVCGETQGEASGHTWINASCKKPKTCSVCGETQGEALGHAWVDATCTEPKTCTECGKTKGEPLGHTISEWEIIKEPTCNEEGEEQGVCTVCNETVQMPVSTLDHTPGEWVVTTEATSSSAGVRTQYCDVCGDEITTEEYTLSDEEKEALYKENCTWYSYDTIARDPDEYKYTQGAYSGQVVQVLEDGDDIQMRVQVNGGSYKDVIYVMYTKKDGESRFLDNDYISVYGINMGTVSYQSVLGAQITIPCVLAEYIDMN